MKIQPECIPCLMKRSLYEIELAGKNKEISKKAMINAIQTLVSEFDPSKCSAMIATEVHRAVYRTLGVEDPYKEVKKRSSEVALSLLPRIEEVVRSSEDPLEAAILCSIIGNILDFGIEGGSKEPEKLLSDFEKYFNQGLGYSDYDGFREILKNSRYVTFVSDNCGEVIFDKVLCKEIRRFNKEIHLTLVVKGKPILSDATREDAERIRFNEVVNEILDTGTFAVGLDLNNIPKRLKDNLERADLIICKGMANYEVFSELDYKPIAYLLRTKCTAVARSIGLDTNINALKVFD